MAAIGVVALAGVSCGGSGDDEDAAGDGSLVVAWESRPETWAPGADIGDGWLRVPYETLVQRSPDDASAIEPMLATEWEQTNEALTLTLQPDVVFHDGAPFGADAVAANIAFVQEQAGPFSAYFSAVESVEAVDDQIVRFNLSEPAPSLLTSLTSRGGLMASPAALEDGTINSQPVGTGPWAYSETDSVPGTRWVFDRFDDYYDPSAVSVERIELVSIENPQARLDALVTGEVDLGDVVPDLAEQAREQGLGVEVYPALHYALMLVDRGPGGALEDVEVRRALCRSLDAEAIVAAAGGDNFGTASTQRFGEGQYGHSPQIDGYPYDPAAASTLQGQGVELNIAVFDANRFLGEAVAGQMQRAGVNLNVQQVPAPDYFENWYGGRYEVGLGDNSELHPYDWYQTWFAADAPNNPSGVESETLKAAADAAIAAGSTPEAEALWQEVMRVIHDEALACLHLEVNQGNAWGDDRVQDVHSVAYMPGNVQYREVTIAR